MRCDYCERRCELEGDRYGICRMYEECGGKVVERFPFQWCSYGVSRIESIPFYHVYPGSRSMIVGTAGCNFRCRYCSNAFIAKEDPTNIQDRMYLLTPRDIVSLAVKLGCPNIVFSINEPTVSLPTLLEVAKEARKEGIPLGCLTNAYGTDSSTGMLESIFSFFNVSLKGFSEDFNRTYVGIPSSAPVLRNIRRLAATRHVEVTTPIIQSVNDHEIDEIAAFLADVDQYIPWHVFRLLPEDEMKDAAYPDIGAINASLKAARRMLPYIYFHNFVGSDWVNTVCPDCGSVLVERFSLGCGGDRLSRFHCERNRCPTCKMEMKMLGGYTEWQRKEALL